MSGREGDALARDLIAARGFADAFGHGLGHGLGLEVHEAPRLSPMADTPLPAHTVVTVEPGIYLPGWGGVRLEDLVLDAQAGTIAYAVVAVPADADAKRFAVPWAALEHDAEQACLVWDVERQALDCSPGLPSEFPEDVEAPHGQGFWTGVPYEGRDRL